MGMFDNYPQPEDYIPDNRPRPKHKHEITIMTGETASHTFDVPFDVNEDCIDIEVIYKLGLNVIITKKSNELDIVSKEKGDWHYSSVTSSLSSEETALFHDTLLDANVQIKFTMKDGAIQYSEIYKVDVQDSLDGNKPTPAPTVIIGFGWTED